MTMLLPTHNLFSPRRRHAAVAAIIALLTGAASAHAQEQPATDKPSDQPATQPVPDRPKESAPRRSQPPTLDDLLGLPGEKSPKPGAKPRPEPEDPTKAELEQKLTAREAAEKFKEAVDLMGQTAQRLEVSKDTGLATQRMQEDILRKLDQLIKSAEQNQQQSRSRSRAQRQQQEQQQQPNQQQQRNPAGTEPAQDTMEPPARREADPNPGQAARGAAWGNLPSRIRDALLQGNADKYSNIYQRWTEAYYRRLAEEANK